MENDNLDTEVLPVIPEIAESEHPSGIEMQEWVFTNDKTNTAIRQLFHGLYNGAFANKLGLMHAKVRDSEEVHTLLVGVEVAEDGVHLHPLAKILNSEELGMYQAPDGNGNYL